MSSPDTPGAQKEVKETVRECGYAMLQAMTDKVEGMAADAAPDEQRAIRDLAGISGPDVMELQNVMGQAFKRLV